ncbi:MFS transporter [Actinokineospora enzanensis]|uniref:MFS transporter n=1 Tax=Actinokineospora enzanensis TaxID=155975 RepID=UPI00039F0255|nr:MFS transporter [Actinokineospora enzanensis]
MPQAIEERSRVLRDPAFLRLWTANGFRDAAAQVAGFSLSVTAVLVLHAQPFQMSLVFVCSRLGYLLIGLPAGVWVDRLPKKRVLVGADIAYAVAFGSIPVAFALGVLTIWQLVLVALALSVAGVFFDVAHTSILPEILPKRAISDANARLQTTDNTIQAISPGIAGVVTQAVAAPLLYTFAALGHLCSALIVNRIPTTAHPATERDFRREIGDGLRFLFGHPLLRLLLSQAALINLGAGIFLSVLPVFLLHDLALPSWLFGLLSSVGAVAGVAASLVCPPLRRRFGEIRMTLLFSALTPFAVVAAPLAGTFPAVAVPLVAAAQVLVVFVVIGRSVAAAGLRARVTPREFMGRVSAANSVVMQGATPLGGLVGGLVADTWSIPTALWLGVVASLVSLVLIVISPWRSRRSLPPEWEV